MLETFLWMSILVLFLFSIIGVIVPFIPDILLLWAGVGLYQWKLASEILPYSFWWGLGIATLCIIAADIVSNLFFVKKYGGDRWTMFAAVAGLLGGPFFLGPVGFVGGPFLAAFAVEWLRSQEISVSAKVAFGTLLAWLSSSVVKAGLQVVIIVWFVLLV